MRPNGSQRSSGCRSISGRCRRWARNVTYRGKSGKHGLLRSISGFDPRTDMGSQRLGPIVCPFSLEQLTSSTPCLRKQSLLRAGPGKNANDEPWHLLISTGCRQRFDVQLVAVELESADLVGADPALIPRDLDFCRKAIAFDRVRSRVCEHRSEAVDTILVCLRGFSALCCDDRSKPLGRDDKVAVGLLTIGLTSFLTVDAFDDEGAQLPDTDKLVPQIVGKARLKQRQQQSGSEKSSAHECPPF